ncbi:hypothetical protein HY3_04970 [Hyphomonas pacifica]|uniref:Uncharacterized protein n=1 Tax=Hyphomonas pacifica TaxID=1280941 RepID=A0A8B2PG20_9PROT|nr:hypothetical protein HY3_04970 [Hyphomonas pacifica]RAN34891.1 hypothetical protein HY11_02535 [Hyphomonas pacifica]
MAYGALEQVSNSRQADMGMRVHIKSLTWRIFHGAKMVEKDERADSPMRMEGQNTTNPEATAEIPGAGFNYARDG